MGGVVWKTAPYRRDAQDTVELPEGGRDQIKRRFPARSMRLGHWYAPALPG